jgi:bifunctional UDP-N-acetylglucosamine pyrophosphorylase/glucosamine-1-phosphate N-acetyltransferase
MISEKTLSDLIKAHITNNSKASLISAEIIDPTGYGRIKRDSENCFTSIVEHKDASDDELKINEINAGIYIFDINTLFSKLSKIKNNNSQGEYYLGDVLRHIDKDEISIFKTSNQSEILGINNAEQLNEIIKKNIN